MARAKSEGKYRGRVLTAKRKAPEVVRLQGAAGAKSEGLKDLRTRVG